MKCFPKSWNYRIEALERRWLLATIFWDGGGDNFRFMDPENWSTNTVPGAQDDVIISVPGSLSVLFVPPNQLAPFPIRSLVCDEELLILGILQIETTADINGHLRLQSGSIQGGEWDVGGGDFTCDDSTANRIIGASVIGDIRLGGGLRSRVAIMDNATFTRVRMAATEFASLGFEPGSTFQGIVRMEQGDCGIGVTSPGSLTFSPGAVVEITANCLVGRIGTSGGYGSPMNLTNLGTIEAYTPYQAWINAQNWVNIGTVRVHPGAQLDLFNAWSNSGTIQLNAGTLRLGGSFATHSLSGLQRNGGQIFLIGTLDNTNARLTFDKTTGSWGGAFSGGTIVGGEVVFVDSYRVDRITLRDVNVEGQLIGDYTLQGSTRFTEARLGGTLKLANGYTLRDPVFGVGNGWLDVPLGIATIAPEGLVSVQLGNFVFGDQQTVPLSLINQGLIETNYTSGSGTTYFTFATENQGLIHVRSGVARVERSLINHGTIQLEQAGQIEFRESSEHGAAGRFLGPGEVQFRSGTHVFTTQFDEFQGMLRTTGASGFGPTLVFQQPLQAGSFHAGYGTFEFAASQTIDFPVTLAGGTITGAGDLTITQTFAWNWGTLDGTGVFAVVPGATLDFPGSSSRTLKRHLKNSGNVPAGNANMSMEGGARFENLVGGIVNIRDCTISGVAGAGHAFDNQGTLNIIAASVRFLNVALNNTGNVNLTGGNLSIQGGGSSSGQINVPFPRVLEFTRTYEHTGEVAISSAGFVQFHGGTHSFVKDQLQATGSVSASSGSAVTIMAGAGFAPSSLTIGTNSTVNIEGTVAVPSLSIGNGGTLGGAGHVIVTSEFQWSSGTMKGGGITTINPGVSALGTPASTSRLARVLQNRGTLSLASLRMGDGTDVGIIQNLAGGLLNLTGTTTSLQADVPGLHRLENEGTLRRTVSTGSVTLDGVALINHGLIDVANGTLQAHGGGTQFPDATIATLAGGMASFSGEWMYLAGSSILGDGTVRFSAGTHDVAAAISTTGLVEAVNAATVRVHGSHRSGALSLSANSSMQLLGDDNHLWITGAVAVGSSSRLDLTDGAMIVDYPTGGPSPLGNPSIPGSIFALITSGYANGAWNGPGINSSTAAADPDGAIGFGEASALFSNFPAMFLGQPVDDTSILLRYTLAGDANLDQMVNLIDFDRLAANFGGSNRTFVHGDFNYDGRVNLADFNVLAARFGTALGLAAQSLAKGALFGSSAIDDREEIQETLA